MADDRDAVILGLGDLGRSEPLRADDVARARVTISGFHAARRRSRLRGVVAIACSAAAAVALTWWVAPTLSGRGFEVVEGDFFVQQDRVAAGRAVASGEWIEPASARACLRVGPRRVCGEPGTRLRVLDETRVELERGRLTADGVIEVTTSIGVVVGHEDGLSVALDGDGQVLSNEGPGVTWLRDGDAVELPTGGRATADAAPSDGAAIVAVAQTPSATEPIVAAPDPATPTTSAPSAPERAMARSPRPAAKPVAPAGDMLVAARELASGGKLAAAATAYQQLLDAHPDSSEARAALVSLGRVQASRGRHAAALAAFTRYLHLGAGPLGEEAHFGRVAALHALGRDAERDRAIAALEAAHPRSVYLPKARALATK